MGNALLNMMPTLAFAEIPVREIRASRQHRGANRYRSTETVFGDAQWSNWKDIKKSVGPPGSIVFGENYDPRRKPRRFMTVIMGVMGATGVREAWRLDHDTRPAPLPLYRGEVGIPMVNAGWWPATGEAPQL